MAATFRKAAGWLAAVVVPPSAVLGVWRHEAAAHAWLTGGALVAYEAGVLLLGVGAGIVRDVWRKRRPAVVDAADAQVGRLLSRFGARYRRAVAAEVRFIDVKSLGSFFTPELDEVFVDVSLIPREPGRAQTGLVDQASDTMLAESARRYAIGDFLQQKEPVVLAVLGAPGSGKTTVLRHTARELCHRRRRRRPVPILLYLRDHAAAIVAEPDVGLADLVREMPGAGDVPAQWFEEKLRGGRCLVLLDGLDEVARSADRQAVSAWVERQVKLHWANDFVITSRPQGYRGAPVDGATVVQTLRFTDEQVRRFVHGWYLAAERRSTGASDPTITRRAEEEALDLLERLSHAPDLYDLTANPLLLTMIANIHRERRALPGRRVELYAEICQVMLGRRQDAKGILTPLSGDQKEAVLRGLAYAMMNGRTRDLARADVVAAVKPPLSRVTSSLTPDDFLADVGSNGLLIERENGLISFAHHTFQEYLASAHIRDKSLSHVLCATVDDPWWRETALLYAARSDADPLVEACLASNSVPALSLALDCADQASQLAPALRERLDGILDAASDPGTGDDRRRLLSGVLAARHFHHATATAAGARICVQPCTTDLYRLFVRDTGHPAPNLPVGCEAIAGRPVVGVRGIDALAFAAWVSRITGQAYRLPTFQEIDDPAVLRILATGDGHPTLTAWTHTGRPDDAPALWAPTTHDDPRVLNSTELVGHIHEDIQRSNPTLARLLLLRCSLAAHSVAALIARDLNLVRALDLTRALDRALDLAHAIDLDLADARDRALDLAHAMDLARAIARDRDSDRAIARTRDLARARDRARDIARDVDRDIDLAHARDRAIARTRDLELDLALTLDHALDFDFDLTLDFDLDFDLNLDLATASAVGSALRRGVVQGIQRSGLGRHEGFSTGFQDALVVGSRVAEGPDVIVNLDLLATTIATACDAVQPPAGATWSVDSRRWSSLVANRLKANAHAVVGGGEALTPERARAIRLAALCLAVEADVANDTALGDSFREIAAGITLLQRRTEGLAPPTETIVLAYA